MLTVLHGCLKSHNLIKTAVAKGNHAVKTRVPEFQARLRNVLVPDKEHFPGFLIWAGCFMLRVQAELFSLHMSLAQQRVEVDYTFTSYRAGESRRHDLS